MEANDLYADYSSLYNFQMIPVAANDVAFSSHAVILTAFTLFQIAIYDVSIYYSCLTFQLKTIMGTYENATNKNVSFYSVETRRFQKLLSQLSFLHG